MGSNVWLLCSSHLNDSRTVEVQFHFRSHGNKTLNASCPVNQNKTHPYYDGHWLVHRDLETHDCILEIRNVNKDTDVGEYQCNGSLPVNGRIEYDMSNQENLIVYQNESSPSSAKPSESGSIIGIAIATGFVVLLLLVVSVRLCVMKCRPEPDPDPNPDPPLSPQRRDTSAAGLLMDPQVVCVCILATTSVWGEEGLESDSGFVIFEHVFLIKNSCCMRFYSCSSSCGSFFRWQSPI